MKIQHCTAAPCARDGGTSMTAENVLRLRNEGEETEKGNRGEEGGRKEEDERLVNRDGDEKGN